MEVERYIVRSDQELVEMSLGGDTRAFEQLFNRYRGSIRDIYAQRMGGGSDEVDDLVQETFVKVYLKLDSYKSKYTFGQWIYTIARNTFIDIVRKQRHDLSLDTIDSGYPPSLAPTPEESIINTQKREQLELYLSRMRPNYRRLIELRFFKDYSYQEIAEELKLPLGTVKTQIHRARVELCKFITENSDIMP